MNIEYSDMESESDFDDIILDEDETNYLIGINL